VSKNTERPTWNSPDIYVIVTCSSNAPKFVVGDVWANRKPGTPAGMWRYFSYGQYNKIGRLSVFHRGGRIVVRLKGCDGKRYEVVITNKLGRDAICEILAGWVTSSESLSSLALATTEV